MSMGRSAIGFALSVTTWACLVGCQSVGGDLDCVAESVERWGTVSISGATLIKPDPRFELDLHLTGNEIFERNRIEGFSRILQKDAFEAQISVRAEVIANLLNQVQATEDPKLLGELKKGLMAAAFEGLLGALPDEQRAIFERAFASLGQRLGGGVQPAGSDYGDSAYQVGVAALTEADKALAIARAALEVIKEEGDKSVQKTHRDEADSHLTAALTALESAATSFAHCAKGAIDGALDAESAIAQLPFEQRAASAKSAEVAGAAKIAGEEARSLAENLSNRLKAARDELTKAFADKPDDHKAAVEGGIREVEPFTRAATTELAETGPAARDKALSAVTQGRQAAALTGMAVTGGTGPGPMPPKLLTAKPIEESRRLALGAVGKALSEGLERYEGPLTLNLQQLLTLTASDKNTLEMLRWLSYPRGYAPGKRVFLCMATVNIVPGRQTYRGYYGQVDLYMEYAKTAREEPANPCGGHKKNLARRTAAEREALAQTGTYPGQRETGTQHVGRTKSPRRIDRVKGRHPICFAVYPLIDAQVLDLRTSRRQLFTTAIQLAVSGYPAAANVLLDHARKREQDVETITGINAVTSYSTGSHLGFTFAPRLSAQADPANINTGPQMALQPQTFPVMIMVICDEESIRDLGYDHLSMYQTARWRRAPDPSSDAWWVIGRPLSELAFPRMSEHEIIKRAEALDRVWDHLVNYRYQLCKEGKKRKKEQQNRVKNEKQKGPQRKCKHRNDEEKSTCDHPSEFARGGFTDVAMATRMNELAAKGVPLPVYFRIPVLQAPETSHVGAQPACAKLDVYPRRGWVNRPSTFHVTSKAPIFKYDFVVTVGGREVNASRLSDHVAQLTLPAWIETFDYEAAVDLDEDARYKANVVVTNGTDVYVTSKSKYADQDPAEPFDIEFVYYAPTPVTAAGGGPTVETVHRVTTARYTDGAQRINLGNTEPGKRHIRITLSRTLKPVSAQLVLREKEPAIVAEMFVDGRNVRTKSPLVYNASDASESEPKNLNHLVTGNPIGGSVLKVEFSDTSVWRLPVKGNLALHKGP